MILSEFNIEYVEHKEIKGQVIADQLVDFPLQDDAPIQVDFPDEHLMYMTKKNGRCSLMDPLCKMVPELVCCLFLLMGTRFLNLTSYYFHVQTILLNMP